MSCHCSECMTTRASADYWANKWEEIQNDRRRLRRFVVTSVAGWFAVAAGTFGGIAALALAIGIVHSMLQFPRG